MVLAPNLENSVYNSITEEHARFSFTGMDFGVLKLEKGDTWVRKADNKECAVLLVEGDVTVSWNNKTIDANRKGVFLQNGWAWHIPCGESISINSNGKSELLIMATENSTQFTPQCYSPNDVKVQRFGENQWDNVGIREVLTFFDYKNAPYSKLVLGEVFAFPGRWSSYPPHYHEQPEIYYYRFDKPQAFGAAFLEEHSYTIKDRNVFLIPGGMTHPQVTAAGYPMYFAWTIKHLKGIPWVDRIFDPQHQWLMDDNISLWKGLPKSPR